MAECRLLSSVNNIHIKLVKGCSNSALQFGLTCPALRAQKPLYLLLFAFCIVWVGGAAFL